VELQIAVAQHRAGQQARLEQHLEAVADAEHRAAARANSWIAGMIGENRAMAPVRGSRRARTRPAGSRRRRP
jgi:hypothetical protein